MTTELETLRAELAETRAVLEDLMHEKRPGETWLLKLLGRREDVIEVFRGCIDDCGDCGMCGDWLCSRVCFRFLVLSDISGDWLAMQVDRANDAAIAEDRRRFPTYGPLDRQRNYAYQRSALSRLFQEAHSQDMVAAWENSALLVNANPNAPDGTTYVMPNMDALDGPAPIRERSEPESPRLERESDKKTDTEPQA